MLFLSVTEDVPGSSVSTGTRTGKGKAPSNGRSERSVPLRRNLTRRGRKDTSFTHSGKA